MWLVCGSHFFFSQFRFFALYPQNSAVKKIISHDCILTDLHILFYQSCHQYFVFWLFQSTLHVLPASVAHQLDARPTDDQEVVGLTPRRDGNILSWRFDHEIFSTVILSLPLIQEGQLSVSGKRMCTILVNRLED